MTFTERLKEITESERQRDYGHPLINFLRIAVRWNILFESRLGTLITPMDVALMMVDMKLARLQNTYTPDSVLDIAGYASCLSRMDDKMIELGFKNGVKEFSVMTLDGMNKLIEVLNVH